MIKFKINKEIKRELAKEIKAELKDMDYVELVVMYNTEKEEFYITYPINVEKKEFEGDVRYNEYVYYFCEKLPTLEEIEKAIFN